MDCSHYVSVGEYNILLLVAIVEFFLMYAFFCLFRLMKYQRNQARRVMEEGYYLIDRLIRRVKYEIDEELR